MTREHRLVLCLAPLIALSVMACEAPEDDGRVTTIIGDRAVVTFARPLCPGDVALIEQTIEHVEGELETEIERPIEISLWSRYDDVAARCGEGPVGCFNDGEVHGLWQALEHELVHAVAIPTLGNPEPLWVEGIAEALSGRTNEGPEDVGTQVGLEDSRQVNYTTAGHFVRWLREEHGPEGIRALAREVPFEEASGRPLTEAIEDYEQEAPWSYPDWNSCWGEPLGPAEADGSFVACQLDTLADEPESDMAGDIIRESAGMVLPTMLRLFVGADGELAAESVLSSMTTRHWRYAYLCIFRCLESFYRTPYIVDLQQKLSFGDGGDLSDALDSCLSWKPREADAIHRLVKDIPATVARSLLNRMEPSASVEDCNIARALAERLYEERNHIAHLRAQNARRPITIGWRRLIFCQLFSFMW